MENLHTLETSDLIDMLAEHTARYTYMLNEGGDQEEYERCKLAIAAIQMEIIKRKQSFEENATATNRQPDFVL